MTSTERSPEEKDRRIRKFFDETIIPAAEKLRDRGVTFFAAQPDKSAQTYFKPYQANEAAVRIETSAIPTLLKELWEKEQLPELVALVDPLLELADSVADESPPDEISPFIYVMF